MIFTTSHILVNAYGDRRFPSRPSVFGKLALRVISNAKALRDIGYKVVFVNALSDYEGQPRKVYYEGFLTYEYRRESIAIRPSILV